MNLNSDGQPENPELQGPLNSIIEAISATRPGIVGELRSFFVEIQRVTVLWEEEWQNLLLKVQNDVARFVSFF